MKKIEIKKLPVFIEAPTLAFITKVKVKDGQNTNQNIKRYLVFSEAPSKLVATAVDELTHSTAQGLKTSSILKYEDYEIYCKDHC